MVSQDSYLAAANMGHLLHKDPDDPGHFGLELPRQIRVRILKKWKLNDYLVNLKIILKISPDF